MDDFLNYIKSLQICIQENRNEIASEKFYEYCERLNVSSKAVSEESTKLCLACCNDVTGKNELILPLLNRLKIAIDSLISTYISTPKIYGKFSNLFLKDNVSTILRNLQEVIQSLNKGDGSYKSALGNLWSQVDNFVSVKKTNCSIVLINLNESNKLINDAISELHQEIQDHSTSDDVNHDEDDDDEASWDDDEIIIVNSVYGILKTMQATCCKLIKVVASNNEMHDSNATSLDNMRTIQSNATNSNSDQSNSADSDQSNLNELDEICEYVSGLSKLVDEVISNLYAPIEKVILHQHVKQLRDVINEMLCKSRYYNLMNEGDIERIEFLEKALSHNYIKFEKSIKQ